MEQCFVGVSKSSQGIVLCRFTNCILNRSHNLAVLSPDPVTAEYPTNWTAWIQPKKVKWRRNLHDHLRPQYNDVRIDPRYEVFYQHLHSPSFHREFQNQHIPHFLNAQSKSFQVKIWLDTLIHVLGSSSSPSKNAEFPLTFRTTRSVARVSSPI